jgi:hypothetical protein
VQDAIVSLAFQPRLVDGGRAIAVEAAGGAPAGRARDSRGRAHPLDHPQALEGVGAAHASHLQVRVLRAELPPILEADLSVSVSCPMPSDHEGDDGDDIDPALPASQLFEQATFALLGCTGGRESRAG